MNVYYELGEYKFEWDSEKAEINWIKHRVRFEMAAEVFLDEYRIDDYDENHSYDEERIRVIGKVDEILTVIYTERGERNRIISARKAKKSEVRDYYERFRD